MPRRRYEDEVLRQRARGLLDLVMDEESKIRVSYILGIRDPAVFKGKEESTRKEDERLYFAANVFTGYS
jgi:hypothetical protein